MKKTKNNADVVSDLQGLTQVFAVLKSSNASGALLQTIEDLINKKLAQVQ